MKLKSIPDEIQIYGDVTFRGDCAREGAEQVTFFSSLEGLHPDIAQIALHIKNEGVRTHGQARWEKANGLKEGASDICIPGAPTFLCELKRKDHTKSRISQKQLDYLLTAKANGAFVCIALGYEAALAAVKDWRKKGE
jgi:hypothetical protein